MFWRKNWHWLFALIVVFGIGGFLLFKPKPPNPEKKVFIVPDLSQVHKDTSNEGNKITPDPEDDSSVTPLESPVETVIPGDEDDWTVSDVEVGTISKETPKTKTEGWRTNSYGESPFGYGPYPIILSDYPNIHRPSWTHGNIAEQRQEVQETLRIWELGNRVRIKLWNQGRTDITSISISPIKNDVYLFTPNTVFVKYEKGTNRISIIHTDPNFPPELRARIMDGEKPPGIQIKNLDTDGFNVFEFLGL